MYNAIHTIARRVSSAALVSGFRRVRAPATLARMATRTSRLPITRLRFRGHAETLNALCRCLQEHPKQALTAAQLADFTDRPVCRCSSAAQRNARVVHHAAEDPDQQQRYRLTLRIEHKSAEEIAQFIQDQTRSETRIAAAFISAFVGLFVLFSVMSALY